MIEVGGEAGNGTLSDLYNGDQVGISALIRSGWL